MADTATAPSPPRPDDQDSSMAVDRTEGPSDSRHGARDEEDVKAEEEERPTMQINRERRESVASSRPETEGPPVK